MSRAGSGRGTTLEAHRSMVAGDGAGAEAIMAAIVREELGLDVASCTINNDGYSLNSLNGAIVLTSGERCFFKFHAEEDGSRTSAEWYRASLLADAGYPVDLPLHIVRTPGREVLLYAWREQERTADACLAVEQIALSTPVDETAASPCVTGPASLAPQAMQPVGHGAGGAGGAPQTLALAVIAEQRALDALVGERLLATLHVATPAECAAEPIHQLFHHRLADDERPGELGARAARFYVDRSFAFPGATVGWAWLQHAHWRVNGVLLRDTFGGLLEQARVLLDPINPALHPAVVAHGDAHNANVWRTPEGLVLFDPAFAGPHVPALLAEVKATFHNTWAHPFWLYHPAMSPFAAVAHVRDDVLDVETDWAPSPLREAFLESKAMHVWKPLLQSLSARGLLSADWRAVVRAALFACPTLVMDLHSDPAAPRGTTRDPVTSLIGLSVAMLVGSEGSPVDQWFDAVAP